MSIVSIVAALSNSIHAFCRAKCHNCVCIVVNGCPLCRSFFQCKLLHCKATRSKCRWYRSLSLSFKLNVTWCAYWHDLMAMSYSIVMLRYLVWYRTIPFRSKLESMSHNINLFCLRSAAFAIVFHVSRLPNRLLQFDKMLPTDLIVLFFWFNSDLNIHDTSARLFWSGSR